MAIDGQYAGHIVISDVVKPHAKQAIEQLRRAGVQKTVMLTGDSKRVADSVAAELGVDEVRSELLPGDKVVQTEALLAANSTKGKLAFVGDGINDAPVLTRADIGIALVAVGAANMWAAIFADVGVMVLAVLNAIRALRCRG